MNIIIAGNGKVGVTLARELSEEGHDLTMIDMEKKLVDGTQEQFDVMGVTGNCASMPTLLTAGVEKADLLIAAASSDEINILACLVAKKLGVGHTIARVRNPEYSTSMSDLRRELKIDMVINPESATAVEITRLLRFPAAANIQTFCQGRVELMSFRLQVHKHQMFLLHLFLQQLL